MAKADLIKALDKVNIKSLNVTNINPKVPKEEKKYGTVSQDLKPNLWLCDNALKTIGKYQVGEKIYLAIEGTIENLSQRERNNKKTMEMNLKIDKVADLTRGGR